MIKDILEKDDFSTLSLDFVKFLVSGFGFGITILGYSYSHTFFRSFGVSLFQLDMKYLDIFYRGISLVVNDSIILFPLAIIVSTILLAIRPNLRQLYGLLAGVIAVTILTVFILHLGQNIGKNHAKEIWANGHGKKVFCRFHEYKLNNSLVEKLTELAENEQIRLIYQSKGITYLAPVLKQVPVGRTTGESYAIPTSKIRYCRVVGT